MVWRKNNDDDEASARKWWDSEDFDPVDPNTGQFEALKNGEMGLDGDDGESVPDWKEGGEGFIERTLRELDEKGAAQLSREMGTPHSASALHTISVVIYLFASRPHLM